MKIFSEDLKVRVRTEEELNIRKYEFLKICKILDSYTIMAWNIKYYKFKMEPC